MKLVDDLGAIWKRWSVKIMAAQVVVIGVYASLALAGLAPDVPEWAKWGALLVLSMAALAVAPFQQKNLPPQ